MATDGTYSGYSSPIFFQMEVSLKWLSEGALLGGEISDSGFDS